MPASGGRRVGSAISVSISAHRSNYRPRESDALVALSRGAEREGSFPRLANSDRLHCPVRGVRPLSRSFHGVATARARKRSGALRVRSFS